MPRLVCMAQDTDLLERVVEELERRKGDLPKVARESGLSYDTVLRIKNRESDPGYSKVRALGAYLFPANSEAQSSGAEQAHASIGES